MFQLLPGSQTGILFNNKVVDEKTFNVFKYRNFYNGGGVAIGDINNDGKPDVFFVANQGSNKLYLNKGNWKFDDITDKAGVAGIHKWHTGVTMADVNGDGWLDIYISNSGDIAGDDRANELYINQKDGTFKEEAKTYGLDDQGLGTIVLFSITVIDLSKALDTIISSGITGIPKMATNSIVMTTVNSLM